MICECKGKAVPLSFDFIFMKNRILFLLFNATVACSLFAQQLTFHKQQSFSKHVPSGNFSGITSLGQGLYAVVDDKKPDGFYVFQIDFKQKSGKLKSVKNQGFMASGLPNRDTEDIVYRSASNSLFINGESDSEVLEYHTDGKPTGRRLSVPEMFHHPFPNRGIEALAYDSLNDRLWFTTECTLPFDEVSGHSNGNVLRLQSFSASTLLPLRQYAYRMEPPMAKKSGRIHVMGVSALTALPDGRLLVLERECYLPKKKVGAWVRCRLFVIHPESSKSITEQDLPLDKEVPFVEKLLLGEWRTRNLRFANYEGMCLGPVLPDGRQVILLISDSQDGYGSLLRDWFKTFVLAR